MTSEFSDISGNTPLKSNDKPKKHSRFTGRMRLVPLGDASAQGVYEIFSSNNSSNGLNETKTMPKSKKITHKRELMEAVRKASTPILLPGRDNALSSSSRNLYDGNGSNSTPEVDSSQRDLESLQDGVHLNARRLNEVKLMVDRRQRELHGLLDELRVLQLENEALDNIQMHKTPVSKKTGQIKQHIAQCTVNMEEQMHLRRQLEHMIRRLQYTQLRVDAQLTGMATVVESSEREGEEVRILCRQLEVGKNRAIQLLQDVQLQMQMERKVRARELGDHEVRARNSQKLEAWRLQRAQERAEMVAEVRGDLSAEEEGRLLQTFESRERANEALHAANRVKSQKNADYEAVLGKLKLAMGASCLREVIDKVSAQTATGVSLDKEKLLAEERLMTVRQEKEQVLQTLNELKASGVGGIELNREVHNTLESEIQQAKATLKVNKAAYERLDGVMSAIRQGSFSLARRLQAFDDVLENDTCGGTRGAGASSMTPTNSMMSLMSSSEHAGYLVAAELKLAKILEIVGQSSLGVNNFGGYDDTGTDGNGGACESTLPAEDGDNNAQFELVEDGNMLWSPTANNDPRLHENNIRVRPTMQASPSATLMAARVGMTLAACDEALDSARSDTIATDSDIDMHMNALVPSREILKMSSSRHFAEVLRKKELAGKQKASAQRGISDKEMMAKLKKRNQLEADARLATSPTRHGVDLFFAKACAIAKETISSDEAGSTIGKPSESLAYVTQMHFNEL